MKRRLVLELKDSFAQHPVYDKLVPFIQNKNAFSERPQFGIVVKGINANKMMLSPDNFYGPVESYVMLAHLGAPVFPLEWVREDEAAIRANAGMVPTPPGIYYLEILKAPESASDEGAFMLDPLLTVSNEPVIRFSSGIETEGQLQHIPVKGTLRLWENDRFLLQEGSHYAVDYETGAITFLDRSNPGAEVVADYRYETGSIGPLPYQWNRADYTTLPGVVMAFGKRGKKGDKVAVVVYEDRTITANAYGGVFELSVDLDIIARDPMQAEEISDLSVMYLWVVKRPRLSSEGIELTSITQGGESDEPIDETGEELTYMSSISVELQAPWEIHIPLPLTISRATMTTPEGDKAASTLDRLQHTTLTAEVQHQLILSTSSAIQGRNNDFERIL